MADLKELLIKYRKGRDGFDDLILEVTHLYGAGRLLPPLVEGEEQDMVLARRLQALSSEDVERALAGKLGTIPLTRAEYRDLLEDITECLKEWLGGEGGQ